MSSFSSVERIYEEETLEVRNSGKGRYADGMFKRCDQNRVHTCGKQRVSSINSWRIKIALERYFEEHVEEIWERNLKKTTLLNMYNLKWMATFLKALREQFREDDQMNTVLEIAGSIPETSLECEQKLKEPVGFWEMSTMDICLKIWC